MNPTIHMSGSIRAALAAGQPVVALESTVISHGLPFPHNLDLARAMEGEVRDQRAQPATIGVVAGVPTVGMSDAEVERFAVAQGILKLSRRDIGYAVARGRDGCFSRMSTTAAYTSITMVGGYARAGAGTGLHPRNMAAQGGEKGPRVEAIARGRRRLPVRLAGGQVARRWRARAARRAPQRRRSGRAAHVSPLGEAERRLERPRRERAGAARGARRGPGGLRPPRRAAYGLSNSYSTFRTMLSSPVNNNSISARLPNSAVALFVQ